MSYHKQFLAITDCVTKLILLKRNNNHGLGAMHLKYIIKTNHVELMSRISRNWFTQNVF